MSSRADDVAALRSGAALAPDRIVSLRSTGMHAIRLEFIVRLLRRGVQLDTLQVYWERSKDMMLEERVGREPRRLVMGWRRRIAGEFPDLWLLCYPEDAEIKEAVEREIDRMVEAARASGAP